MPLRIGGIMNVTYGRTDCSPSETGYDAGRIDVLCRKFEELVDRKIIHGASFCISHKGKIIANGGIGRNNALYLDSPMLPDTVFGIASITKTFTATAIMQLVENGDLRLDVPVGEILPQFAEKPFDGIKVWHLLTHTSGLYPDGGCFPETAPKDAWELIAEAETHWDKTGECDWIRAGISGGLRVPTGTRWQYSSFGFVLLGEIVSKVSKQDVHEYIKEHIILPLGLSDTGFKPTRADSHTLDIARRLFIRSKEHQEKLNRFLSGENMVSEESTVWDKIPQTGGGLYSTVGDLVKFGNAYVYGGRFDGARILGRKAVEKMSTVQLHNIPDYCWGSDEPNRLYGIGFDMRQGLPYSYSPGTIMHEGAGASSLNIDPKEELAAAWYVPFDTGANGWSAEPLYNVQNIIWSGLI